MTRARTKTRAEQVARPGHFQLIVDVHLLMLRNGRILLGRRANTGFGDGAYEPPSGRLAERETIVEAAMRVAAAQAGVTLCPARVSLAHVMHDVSGAGRIAFFLTVDEWDGDPRGTAENYSDLGWFPVAGLPANMIDRARVAVRNYAAGARFSTYPAFDLLFDNRTGRDFTLHSLIAMQLIKTHGSRNEIFVVPATEFGSGEQARGFARRVCDRSEWTGGGDGVYFFDAGASLPQAWFANPDGSSAEFCGNGMRGLGRHIMDLRGTGIEVIRSGGRSYTVRQGADGPVRQVVLELPPVTFGAPAPAPFGDFTAVDVPNPHVVAMRDGYDEAELVALGKRAARVFPDGANVSVVVPLSPDEIFVRTYERGAELTPACGSGVIAARAVYSRLTATDPGKPVLVRNVGGVATAYFQVRDGRWLPRLEGNATVVYRAEADQAGAALAPPAYATEELTAYARLDDQNTACLRAARIAPLRLPRSRTSAPHPARGQRWPAPVARAPTV